MRQSVPNACSSVNSPFTKLLQPHRPTRPPGPALLPPPSPSRTVLLEEPPDAVEPLRELVLRLRVGEPDEALPPVPECGPGQQCDPGLGEQPIGKLALVEAGALDVGKGVEGALRLRAPHAGDRVETVDHEVPPVLENPDHAVHRSLGLVG